MLEIKYLCYFYTWYDWMEGKILINSLEFNYNFVAEGEDRPGDYNHVLTDFSEEGARKHFASFGIHDIEFIYPQKKKY